jgi:hypothetical protein
MQGPQVTLFRQNERAFATNATLAVHGGLMRSSRLVLLLALVSCDPQADSAYPGEPLLTLRGFVKSSQPQAQLEAAMLWQHGDPPLIGDEDLATRAPVEAGFPSSFTVHLYHPPPAGAQRTLAAGEAIWARAVAAAIPYGIAASQLGGGAGSATPGPVVAGNPNYGVDANHWVVYLAADVPATSITAWWLGAPLTKGFHLLRVAAVDPKCMTQAQLDACAASLVARGARDDGSANPGTARSFCLAPYRLSPAPPDEELVLDLGSVGLGPAGSCP